MQAMENVNTVIRPLEILTRPYSVARRASPGLAETLGAAAEPMSGAQTAAAVSPGASVPGPQVVIQFLRQLFPLTMPKG